MLISEMRVKLPLFGISHSPGLRDRTWCVQTGLELIQKKNSLSTEINFSRNVSGCLKLCRLAIEQEWMFPTGSIEVCSSSGKDIVSEKRRNYHSHGIRQYSARCRALRFTPGEGLTGHTKQVLFRVGRASLLILWTSPTLKEEKLRLT